MVVIRAGSPADAAQIAEVQREGWFAAYRGIIPAEIIDRVTAADGGARVRQPGRDQQDDQKGQDMTDAAAAAANGVRTGSVPRCPQVRP